MHTFQTKLKHLFGHLLVASLLISPATAALANQSEALSTEELRELQSKMSRRQYLSLDFVQIRTSALRPKKPAKSSGTAIFAKPSRFRWEIQKPQGDVLIFDGKNLFSFKPGDQTATRFKTQGEKANEINEVIDFVMDFDALLKRYQLMESTRSSDEIFLKLKPKSEGPIAGIDISIDGKKFFVRSLKMSFNNKNTSEFQFSNPSPVKIDVKSFAVPETMKIVDGV